MVSGKTIAYVLTDLISKAKLQKTEQRRDALIRLIGSKKKNWVNVTEGKEGHWNVKWILTKNVYENVCICYKDTGTEKEHLSLCAGTEKLQWHNQLNHRTREEDYQMQSFHRTWILRNNENTSVSDIPLVVLNNSLILFKAVCTEGARTSHCC